MNSAHPDFSSPNPDALRDWTQHHRTQFDAAEPSADLWAAIEAKLDAPAAASPDALHTWAQHHRAAFDTLEPRADAWAAIEAKLNEAPVARPVMTASRGGASTRPAWWQMAAAAVVVFGLGYGLRVGTETNLPGAEASVAVATPQPDAEINTENPDLHVAAPRPSFHNQEPEPALQATVLASHVQPMEEAAGEASEAVLTTRRAPARTTMAPEIARLEARYAALVARQRATSHRFVGARTLADEWDREMSVLDSTYVALRQELARKPRTDEVVRALDRNLHLRLKLIQQQLMALDAEQATYPRNSNRVVPRRPPTVNPEDNGVNVEDAYHGGTLVPPAPPVMEPLPGAGANAAPRRARLEV